MTLWRGGRIPFRNLTYFQRCHADPARADVFEGSHVDLPQHSIRITRNTGETFLVNAAFVNAIKREKVHVFCLSTVHAEELYDTFSADCCVEIFSPASFIASCQRSLMRKRWKGRWRLLSNVVEYYAADEVAQRNIKDPRLIPFFKPDSYRTQHEFRIAFAEHQALELQQRIVMAHVLTEEEMLRTEKPCTRWLRTRNAPNAMRVHRNK